MANYLYVPQISAFLFLALRFSYFKMQITKTVNVKKFTKQEKRQKNSEAASIQILPCLFDVLYCLKRLISAFQLV
ncbi:MAG: hypothetical protein PG978_001394 [Wolbachia endosymbiont of Ctenocephalides felis wCfeF]|nr:MAG: hypothetical protein PG978_001394 [Wolbachia endosymbiont of Ctenocephalides felis wCfeF]